jgi:hypothetical protein
MVRRTATSGKCVRGVIAARVRRNRAIRGGRIRNRGNRRVRRDRPTPRPRNLPRHICFIPARPQTHNRAHYVVSYNSGHRSFDTLAEVIYIIIDNIIFLIFYLGGSRFSSISIWGVYYLRT